MPQLGVRKSEVLGFYGSTKMHVRRSWKGDVSISNQKIKIFFCTENMEKSWKVFKVRELSIKNHKKRFLCSTVFQYWISLGLFALWHISLIVYNSSACPCSLTSVRLHPLQTIQNSKRIKCNLILSPQASEWEKYQIQYHLLKFSRKQIIINLWVSSFFTLFYKESVWKCQIHDKFYYGK